MEVAEISKRLRNQIGDNDLENPNITLDELDNIINNAAMEYSRIKGYLAFAEIPYNKNENVYIVPNDSYKVKSAILKNTNYKLKFIDNLNQIIIEDEPYVESDTIKLTYIKYFKPEEIDEREIDIYLILCESLCYKLMASKTAEYVKFSTGEKMMDESLISEKYLNLYKSTFKIFKNKVIKAYGRRFNNLKPNLDYDLPYPPLGERI